MQVAQNKVEGLKHSYTVTVPDSEVAGKIEARLEEIRRSARLPGFRPGKAPVAHIKQRYGQAVRAEVLEDVINDSSRSLMNEHKLRPALQPHVSVKEMEEGKDFSYEITLEVLPEIKPVDFKSITIERLTVTVEKGEVDKAIDQLAKMRKSTKKVEGKRAAKSGDSVKIDFDGSVDGESKPGMKAEGFMLELGSQSFIDTFEDQLIGSKAGDEKVVTVTFPEAYHAKDLAGKVAEFKVTVHEIHEPAEVTVDDEFAKGFGVESLEKLREQIEANIGESYKSAARVKAKRMLLDELAKAHDFAVPEGMVEFEFNAIWNQRAQQGPDPEEKGTTEEEIKAEYRDIAERRVRLGLLLAEIGRENKVDVSQDDLRQALFAQARQYPGQERQVIEYYMKNQQALESLKAPIFEDKVVDFLFELVNVTDKQGTIDDLRGDMDDDGDSPNDEAKAEKKPAKKAQPKKEAAEKSELKSEETEEKPAKKASTKKADPSAEEKDEKSAAKKKASGKKS